LKHYRWRSSLIGVALACGGLALFGAVLTSPGGAQTDPLGGRNIPSLTPANPRSADTRVEKPNGTFKSELGQVRMADRMKAYLQRTYQSAPAMRQSYWSGLNFNSPEDYDASVAPYRAAFMQAIGIPEVLRHPQDVTLAGARLIRTIQNVDIYRWQLTLGNTGLEAEALVGFPKRRRPPFPVVVGYYGAQGSPETCFGLNGKSDYHKAFALHLAQEGYVVYIPYLVIDRNTMEDIDTQGLSVGWRLMGMEVGLTMRALDYLAKRTEIDPSRFNVYGISYGGGLSLYLGAVDPRIKTTIYSGAFFDEPTVFEKSLPIKGRESYFILPGNMTVFSLPMIPRMIAPRAFFIEHGTEQSYTKDANFLPVQAIYDRLGMPEETGIIADPGGHEVYLRESLTFLKRISPPALETTSR
jgi:hypothetical protein